MSLINFKNILSCSSEDRVHSAKNLLKPEQSKKWLSSRGTKDQIICILEFEKPSFISSIDIGNDGSAFIELLVSNSSEDNWTVLLPSTSLMSPNDSNSNTNRNEIKSLKSDDLNKICLNEKWTRLKIICEQKFNRVNQFGLNFIKLYSISDKNHQINIFDDEEDETEKEQKKIGSFFAKKQAEKKLKANLSDENQTNNQSQIMKNIVFVLSGFQNPLRSELRNKATSMGAIYNEDWDEKCTHLICAFPNTPKFAQVEQTGKGLIVNKQWILDCYKQNQLLPEKSYELKETNKRKTKDPEETTVSKDVTRKTKDPEEITVSKTVKRKTKDPEETGVSKVVKRKTPVKKKSVTTNEDKADKMKINELPDFFHGIHFYVSYGDYDDNTLLDIVRVILAYDGIIERQINTDVKYVITNRMWNQDFEKISKSHPDINFINLDWLQDCHDANQFVSIEPYLMLR